MLLEKEYRNFQDSTVSVWYILLSRNDNVNNQQILGSLLIHVLVVEVSSEFTN